MKHLRIVSQQPQKAQTTLQIKLENKLAVIDNAGQFLFAVFGHSTAK